MKRLYAAFLLSVAVGIVWTTPVSSSPDSRDSVIIESKSLKPSIGHPAAAVRVYITNKDSLTSVVLSLVEKTLTGNAYMTLYHPRQVDSVVHQLTQTLAGYKRLSDGQYNSVSPDTFIIGHIYEPGNLASVEPPNAVRKSFLEIWFDSVKTDSGRIAFDSARILGPSTRNVSTGFVDMQANDVTVNFVKGIITVDPIAPSVTVTFPNGGESVPKPCPSTITWNATDNVGVTGIEIRLDRFNDGVFEQQIANLSSNPGSYNWTPGGSNSTHAKIKIIASDGAGNSASDVSDSPFLITTYCLGRPAVIDFDINNDGVVGLVDAVIVINSSQPDAYGSSTSLSREYIESMLNTIFSDSP